MRLIKSPPQLTVEAIDHQSGDFFETLTEIIRSGNSATYKGLIAKGIDKDLAACIKRFTNLSVKLTIPDSFEYPGTAWICTPVTDMNHAILDQGIRQAYELYFTGKSLIGEHTKQPGIFTRVDLAKGKVYGGYTNIVADMAIGDEFFNGEDYTPEEAAAVILHEIGHYFSYVEFISASITTNFVLAQMADGLSRTTNPKERESYIIAAKQVLGNSSNIDPEELSQAHDINAVQIVLVKDYVETKRLEFGYDVFNESTWEAMADQFAARQGAGRALLTMLDKLERRYGSDLALRGKVSYYFVEAIKTVLLLGGFVTGGITSLIALVMMIGDSANEPYGRLPVRYERIRAELVARLKDRKISKEEVASLTADIEVVDGIMKTVSDQRQWFSYLGAMIFSSKREYYKAEAIARELEKFGANDFFLHAAKLRLLASMPKAQ
jgi:hypothetical protein